MIVPVLRKYNKNIFFVNIKKISCIGINTDLIPYILFDNGMTVYLDKNVDIETMFEAIKNAENKEQ